MISNPLGSRASAYERVVSRRGALLRSRQAVRHPVQLRRLSGRGCTMSRGSDKQHSSHLPLPPGPLLGTRTHSAGRRSSVARHMCQKKVFLSYRYFQQWRPLELPTNQLCCFQTRIHPDLCVPEVLLLKTSICSQLLSQLRRPSPCTLSCLVLQHPHSVAGCCIQHSTITDVVHDLIPH